MSSSSTMEQKLTQDQIAEFKEAFSLFDKAGKGTVPTKDLGIVMRSLGFNPTEAELQDMMNQVDVNKTGTMNFDEFLNLMAQRGYDNNGTEEEILEAFRIFDKDKSGFMSAEQIKHLMWCGSCSAPGKHDEDEELNEMIKVMPVNENGLINYVDFVKKMMEKD